MNTFDKSGFLLINKPVGISSYDCIRHIKKTIKYRGLKIGHAGTLDEFASGLMIIAIGRQATKQLTDLSGADKEYIAKGKLGEMTDSLDRTGRIIKECPWQHITNQDIENALAQFAQHYEQIPPAISALKHQGSVLYKLARQNTMPAEEFEKILENKKRMVTIYSYKLDDFAPPFFTITTTVSKGTYIRSLINDLAQACGSCATTHELSRTKVGNFTLAQAIELENLKTVEDVANNLF